MEMGGSARRRAGAAAFRQKITDFSGV